MKKTKRLAAALLTIMAVSTACVASAQGRGARSTGGRHHPRSRFRYFPKPGNRITGGTDHLAWDQNFNIAAMNTAAEYYRKAGHPDFNLNIIEVEENAVETKSITAFTSGVSEGMPDILLMGDYSAQSFLNNYKANTPT